MVRLIQKLFLSSESSSVVTPNEPRDLLWVKKSWGSTSFPEIQIAVESLKNDKGSCPLGEIATLLEFMLAETEKVSADEKPACMKVVASTVKLFVLHSADPSAHSVVESVLTQCLHLDDSRVVANVIETMTALRHDKTDVVRELIFHKDNRVAANALVHLSLRGVSPVVLKGLRRLLDSKNSFAVASGLYALAEITSSCHSVKDLHVFTQNLQAYEKHPHPSVRRQAQSVRSAMRNVA